MIMNIDGTEKKVPLRVSRDDEIKEAIKKKEDIMVQETKILQKVNKVHREAFKEKFPGQIEHCMRLTAERLQAILTKKPTEMATPDTWDCTAGEIHDLAHGLYYLSIMNQHYPIEGE